MFSPITQRSLKIRLLNLGLYVILLLGGATMVIPFLIMLSGSMDPRAESRNQIFPTWLFHQERLWECYLETKYQSSRDLLRMAWNDPGASFRGHPEKSITAQTKTEIKLWEQFLKERHPAPNLFLLGFRRANTRMPSYTGREFQIWLSRQYGNDLERLNRELQTRFSKITAIQPPNLALVGLTAETTRFNEKYFEFVGLQPQSRLIPWNAGGFYRSVFLPQMFADEIASYNLKYETNYSSFREIPFSGEAPRIGTDDWFLFVTKVLRADFVGFTETGVEKFRASGLTKEEFISSTATLPDLKVVSLDVIFSDWCVEKGILGQNIPQEALDRLAFQNEAGFWRTNFMTMNFLFVLDEMLLHGRSIANTAILILLSVLGALIVNPLAAYALSRFKLKNTYFILIFCLATISFPAEVTMIPVFLQMREFHLLNTFGALVLPTLASGFFIFLLKGFFDSLPKELYEAAELDGASEWMMFWQITINLSKPILAVMALGAFTTAYGAYFYALILAPDPKMWTIMVEIYQMRISVDPPVVFASLIITAVPPLIMFLFCQNLILRGIVVPSEK